MAKSCHRAIIVARPALRQIASVARTGAAKQAAENGVGRAGLALQALDSGNDVADGAELVGFLVGEVDLVLLFNRHHEIH